MKTASIKFVQLAAKTTLFVFLFLTLKAIPSLSQSVAKPDSNCLCGPKADIDSALKILNDYPDLLRQSDFCEKLLGDLRKLSIHEQSLILEELEIKGDWDIEVVTKKIKRIKRASFWTKVKRVVSYAGSTCVGFTAGFFISKIF